MLCFIMLCYGLGAGKVDMRLRRGNRKQVRERVQRSSKENTRLEYGQLDHVAG
jgi:hypothetical protein